VPPVGPPFGSPAIPVREIASNFRTLMSHPRRPGELRESATIRRRNASSLPFADGICGAVVSEFPGNPGPLRPAGTLHDRPEAIGAGLHRTFDLSEALAEPDLQDG